MAPYSLQDYCAGHLRSSSTKLLPVSSLQFLQQLHLPTNHPFCQDSFPINDTLLPMVGLEDVHESNWHALLTYWYMTIPPLYALVQLWVRLLSGVLVPAGILFLLWATMRWKATNKGCTTSLYQILGLLTTATSIILFTDSQYVLEFGTVVGIVCFFAAFGLTHQHCRSLLSKTSLYTMLITSFMLLFDWHKGTFHFGIVDDVDIRIQPGLYYDQQSVQAQTIVRNWSPSKRLYNHGTPWMYTGDARTGLPFFFNRVPSIDWTRVFLTLKDGEVLALDVAFPKTGHDGSNPVYLVLHGVNGGSREGYVLDLAYRRNAANSTVITMVSRGLMELPVKGWDLFHGARWSDAHEAAVTVHRAMEPGQLLVGVGYSMGAIILSNYVASSGPHCAFDAAFSISGALDCRFEQFFERSQRMWQPMIADNIRERYVAKFAERTRARLGKDMCVRMLRATNVVELDNYTAVAYNGFANLSAYYTAMGAISDIPLDQLLGSQPPKPKISKLAIPHAVLHALDDPISTWKTNAANEGWMRPDKLVQLANGNLFLLLTQKGGHVGWPVGWRPSQHGWEFMNEAAASFVDAVVRDRHPTRRPRSGVRHQYLEYMRKSVNDNATCDYDDSSSYMFDPHTASHTHG